MDSTSKKHRARGVLGVAFTCAGVGHFTHARLFENLVPASLAAYRREINAVTGLYQTAAGLAFFSPRRRGLARWSAIALLVPTFPEAFRQVREPQRMTALGIPPQIAAARIVAQTAVLALVWWSTESDDDRAGRPKPASTHPSAAMEGTLS